MTIFFAPQFVTAPQIAWSRSATVPEHTTTLCSSFYLHELSEEKVVRLIEIFSEGKSKNKNDVPTKVIKLSKFVLAPVLTRIFNKCINEGFYPDCLKVAEVIPICKSGEQNICSKYRPISVLLQFNKIFEGMLYDRMHFYPKEYKSLSKYKFVSGLNLQLRMQLRVITSIILVMLIMDYIPAPYFLIYQKHLTLKIITFYLINIIITLALEEFPYNYFVFVQSQTICKGGKCAMLFR